MAKYTLKKIGKALVATASFPAEGRKPPFGRADGGALNADFLAGEFAAPALNALGETVLVGIRENPGGSFSIVLRDDDGEGWPGNSSPVIRRFHGWRGSYNDIATYAYGVRQVLTVSITGKRSRRVKIVFGPDQAADKE